MKTKKIYIILFTLILVAGCKKQHRYEDDPKSTFDTPNERLSGIWQLNEYTLNGASIISNLNNISGAQSDIRDVNLSYSYIEENKKDKYYAFKIYSYTARNNFDGISIEIGPDNSSAFPIIDKWFITPFKFTGTPAVSHWIVTKLYDKDLHLKLQTDTGEFKMFFNKIHK